MMLIFNKRFVCLLFFIFFASLKLAAEVDNDTEPDLSSPYHSVYNHLYYLQDESFDPEKASLSLYRTENTESKLLQKRSMSLKRIFDAGGNYIELDEIPKDPNYYDSTLNKNRYYPIEEDKDVYLEKYGDKWLYSKKTVSLIEKKHQAIFPPGTEWIVHLLQMKGHSKIFGFYTWQLIGLLLLAIIGILIQKSFKIIFNILLHRLLKKFTGSNTSQEYFERVAGPASLFIVSLLMLALIPVLQLPVIVSKYTLLILKALYPFFGMLAGYRMVDLFGKLLETMAAKTENTLDDQLVPLIRKSLRVFVLVVGVLFILQNLNFNITALLAGISIGGLAFALAAQDTLKNLFGSLMIFMDKPFQVGDWISSGDIDGEVEEVGFRSTRIRTFRNSLMYVSNGKLADSIIDNHGMRVFRRFYTRLSITYGTTPRAIQAFVKGLNKIVQEHPHTRKDKQHIVLNEFGASGLEIMFYIFFKVPNWGEELNNRHDVMLKIIELADELGVKFAFPTQTLHVETFARSQNSAEAPDTDEQLAKKLNRYYKKQGYSESKTTV